MQIGVIGINHKLANLTLREHLVKATCIELEMQMGSCFQYVYLATCNRVEIYFSSPDLTATHGLLLQHLCDSIEEEIAHKLYSYFCEDCFVHLAKVTAGLDSALLFETEIQGQVKRAYQEAILERVVGPEVHYLFQKSLTLGKKIRSRFSPQVAPGSLEEAIVAMGHSLFGALDKRRVLFVGVSEINRKIAYSMKERGIASIEFSNRSSHKGALVEGLFPLHSLERIERWHHYDLIIFGTTALDYLLVEGEAPDEKKLLIDLSVPRNVHPKLGKLSNVTLMNIDQIHRLLARQNPRHSLVKKEMVEVVQGVKGYIEAFQRKRSPVLELVG